MATTSTQHRSTRTWFRTPMQANPPMTAYLEDDSQWPTTAAATAPVELAQREPE
jgi:hypothetical protein